MGVYKLLWVSILANNHLPDTRSMYGVIIVALYLRFCQTVYFLLALARYMKTELPTITL